jgi:signal transduction histidine kinase
MKRKLRVLIIDDDEKDAVLLVRELRRGGYDPVFERVDTPEAMSSAIADQTWDLVISDYSMPHFSVAAALSLVKAADLDLPFIVTSGAVGEEVAVDAMRSGAHDFMPKGRLTRLLPAISRELREATLRAEHRGVEHRLRQAQKIETIGQLTGGIAHDFNNLLAVIIGSLDELLNSGSLDAIGIELVNYALEAGLRGADLTNRLLAVARQQPLSTQVIDLNERLPGVIAMLRRTLGESIHIDVQLMDGLWPVRTDPSQIEAALLNLAVNARDAMLTGGTLTIETANVTFDEHDAAARPEIAAGDYVVLSVTDTGVGMPPEIIERVVEPFFTTKPLGKGTGLGLSMVYGFARQSSGTLSIYSEVGVGTTMRLYLPGRAEVESTDSAVSPHGGAMVGGDEAILVVDDNEALREVAVRQLTGLGYKCREADNGPAALAILGSEEHFDLLFSDIGLPEGMNGEELARLATQRQPGLKVLLTTGYANVQKRNESDPREPLRVLRKPYRGRELAEMIRIIFATAE